MTIQAYDIVNYRREKAEREARNKARFYNKKLNKELLENQLFYNDYIIGYIDENKFDAELTIFIKGGY